MATKRRSRAGAEWVAGIVTTPAYVHSPGAEPYRPELVAWLDAKGRVPGASVDEPDVDRASRIATSFESATRSPLTGKPHVPSRVRVESEELVEVFRAALPSSIEVICAPTPELEMLREGMVEFLSEGGPEYETTYFAPGIDAAALEVFFAAAARLYRAAPWKLASDLPICVTVEARGIERAILSVLGNAGQEFGFLSFRSMEDYDQYLVAADTIAAGEEPELPTQLVLNFERASEIDEALRDEVARHGWTLAGKNAYPWVAVVDEDLVARAPTPEELAKVTTIADALAELTENHRKEAARFFDGEEPVLTIESPLGRLVFEDAEYVDSESPAAVALIEDFDPRMHVHDEHGEFDQALLERYQRTILDLFAASPEAAALEAGPGWLEIFMDYLASYTGQTVATMTVPDLNEVVFDIFPRKVSCDASEASGIIEELRAVLTFLRREYGVENADECLEALDEDAAKDLERELSNPANFGMAKSMVMAGKDAGYDMRTKEGVEAWMAHASLMGLGPPLPAAPRAQTKAADRAKKKKKKKAAKASKRKNR